MNSLLNGRQSGKTTKGRTLECGSLMPAKSGVSRLDIQAMIQQALDERHAVHQAGECWCTEAITQPVKRESERRLHLKDRKEPSLIREYQITSKYESERRRRDLNAHD